MKVSFVLKFKSTIGLSALMILSACGGGYPPPGRCANCPVANKEVLYLSALGVPGSSGQAQAFPINPTSGALGAPFNVSPSAAGGMIPTPDSGFAYTADSQNNQVDGFAVDPATGALTPIAGSPFPISGPINLATAAGMDPSGKFLYVSDFNGSDIIGFSIDKTTGALVQFPGSPFNSGFSPDNVLVSTSNLVEVFDVAGGISSYTMNPATGALTPGVSGPLTYFTANWVGDIVMHSNGKYLYMTQGMTSADSGVAAFTLDQTTGFPTLFAGGLFPTGPAPRNAVTDPSTKFLYTANTGDGTISGFSIDSSTGMLTPVPGSPFSATKAPAPGFLVIMQLAVDPSGKFLYATNTPDMSISIFSISATGALSLVGNTPVSAEPGVMRILILP